MKAIMKAPNEEVGYDDISYPVLASFKMDGVRSPVHDGVVYSSTWKRKNSPIQQHFAEFLNQCKHERLFFDGEIWSPKLTFSELGSALAEPVLADHIGFYVFDMMTLVEWNTDTSRVFFKRAREYQNFVDECKFGNVFAMQQYEVTTPGGLRQMFWMALDRGYEGLIVRSKHKKYKHGRATLREASMWKFKEWVTVDVQIIGFEQATRMTKAYRESDRGRNEDGSKARTTARDTRQKIEDYGSIKVRDAEGKQFCVGISKEASHLRDEITWARRHEWVGRWVEIKYQEHGTKDKPRFGRIVRLRPDLD